MSDDWHPGPPPDGDPYGNQGQYDQYGGHHDATGGYAYGAPGGPGGYAYGAPGGPGQVPGGYPPPWAPYGWAPPSQGSAIGALVVSTILMMTCCTVFAVIGVVFSALALGERYDHERAARLTRYAWITNLVILGLILLLGVLAVIGIVSDL